MIEVESLSKVYGSTPAIENLSFTVEAGEIMGFLGPNGAGKTTTMRILTGYLPASKGTAKLAGYDVHQQSMEVRRRMGYLPEIPPLYPEMTVEEFLDFVAKIKGIGAGDRPSKISSAIQRCQLSEKRKIAIRKLSKGYKQRVGIAQAIVHDPPAIILDEPTVGLDPRQIIEVRNLIKSLAGDHTIILSTHILPEVSVTCDRVTIINQGKIAATNVDPKPMGSGYEIEVEGDVREIGGKLEAIEGVAELEVRREGEYSFLKVNCRGDKEPGKEIAKIIVSNSLGLREMRRTRASLEDVFLAATINNEQTTNYDCYD